MAELEIDAHHVTVRLTTAEKIFALRGDHRFALADVESVEVVSDGLAATRGMRAPGLGMPGVRKVGTWRSRDGKELVSVGRDQPAVRITLRDGPFRAVLIGVDDPASVAAALEAAAR